RGCPPIRQRGCPPCSPPPTCSPLKTPPAPGYSPGERSGGDSPSLTREKSAFAKRGESTFCEILAFRYILKRDAGQKTRLFPGISALDFSARLSIPPERLLRRYQIRHRRGSESCVSYLRGHRRRVAHFG